jgi:hypothetical protein
MHEHTQTRGNREREGGADDLRIDLDWPEVRAALTTRWTKLDPEDVNALGRNFDAFAAGDTQALVGRLRERYGLDQFTAEDQVRQFVRSLVDQAPSSPEHSGIT